MEKKKLNERFMLEGSLGYIAHLSTQLHNGKIKTIEQLSEKLDNDAKAASGALSNHLEYALKIAGFDTDFPKTTGPQSN